jgi:hypothetical protein
MKSYTYSEARQSLSELLDTALNETVIIHRRDGRSFTVAPNKTSEKSPFDIPGIQTKATTQHILDAVRQSRARA